MPRDGAIIFSDLIGKLDLSRVRCDKCGRDGCCHSSSLIEERGRDGKIVDWLDALTAHCPVKKAHNWNDQCAARCPELAKVL
jgi:hypothetical protein